MAETKRTLSFAVYSDSGIVDPWSVTNSTPAFPSNYTSIADPAKILAGRFVRFSGSGNTVLIDDTPLTGDVIAAETTLGLVNSDAYGLTLSDAAGNGWQVLINSTNIRIYALSAGVLGSLLATISFVAAPGDLLRFEYVNSTDTLNVYTAGVLRGTSSQASANTDWRAGVFVRNNAAAVDLISAFTSGQTLDTITDPITPGEAFSGTSTGFTDGAATISFTGQSIDVTIAGGAFSGVIPALADGEEWPVLPATDQVITLTQGANTATLAADIGLPAGYEVTRDGSNNPANFLGIVTNDDTYLGTAFNDAGNPLTENNRAYYEVTARNILIERDGAVSADVGDGPITAKVFIPREDGNVYEHEITISEAGQLVSVGGLTLRAITMRSLTMRQLTARSL